MNETGMCSWRCGGGDNRGNGSVLGRVCSEPSCVAAAAASNAVAWHTQAPGWDSRVPLLALPLPLLLPASPPSPLPTPPALRTSAAGCTLGNSGSTGSRGSTAGRKQRSVEWRSNASLQRTCSCSGSGGEVGWGMATVEYAAARAGEVGDAKHNQNTHNPQLTQNTPKNTSKHTKTQQ